jgi:hypothetical protein
MIGITFNDTPGYGRNVEQVEMLENSAQTSPVPSSARTMVQNAGTRETAEGPPMRN